MHRIWKNKYAEQTVAVTINAAKNLPKNCLVDKEWLLACSCALVWNYIGRIAICTSPRATHEPKGTVIRTNITICFMHARTAIAVLYVVGYRDVKTHVPSTLLDLIAPLLICSKLASDAPDWIMLPPTLSLHLLPSLSYLLLSPWVKCGTARWSALLQWQLLSRTHVSNCRTILVNEEQWNWH